jgi:hypothetical protein
MRINRRIVVILGWVQGTSGAVSPVFGGLCLGFAIGPLIFVVDNGCFSVFVEYSLL